MDFLFGVFCFCIGELIALKFIDRLEDKVNRETVKLHRENMELRRELNDLRSRVFRLELDSNMNSTTTKMNKIDVDYLTKQVDKAIDLTGEIKGTIVELRKDKQDTIQTQSVLDGKVVAENLVAGNVLGKSETVTSTYYSIQDDKENK